MGMSVRIKDFKIKKKKKEKRTLTDTRVVEKVQIKDNERHPLLGSWELRWKLYFKRHF